MRIFQYTFETRKRSVISTFSICMNESKTYCKFVSLKSQMRIGFSAAGKIYCVCALLQNAGTCLYGNQISKFFQFICLGSLAFLFILQCIKERKYTNICLFSNSH